MVRIELTPQKRIPGAVTIWQQAGPEVDVTMEIKALTFREESIDEIYAFYVLDHLFLEEIPTALANWRKCLAKNGRMFLVVDDFEWLSRAFVGGDVSIDVFNERFAHPTQFTRENLGRFLNEAGFHSDFVTIWFTRVNDLFDRQPHELVMSAEKV